MAEGGEQAMNISKRGKKRDDKGKDEKEEQSKKQQLSVPGGNGGGVQQPVVYSEKLENLPMVIPKLTDRTVLYIPRKGIKSNVTKGFSYSILSACMQKEGNQYVQHQTIYKCSVNRMQINGMAGNIDFIFMPNITRKKIMFVSFCIARDKQVVTSDKIASIDFSSKGSYNVLSSEQSDEVIWSVPQLTPIVIASNNKSFEVSHQIISNKRMYLEKNDEIIVKLSIIDLGNTAKETSSKVTYSEDTTTAYINCIPLLKFSLKK